MSSNEDEKLDEFLRTWQMPSSELPLKEQIKQIPKGLSPIDWEIVEQMLVDRHRGVKTDKIRIVGLGD